MNYCVDLVTPNITMLRALHTLQAHIANDNCTCVSLVTYSVADETKPARNRYVNIHSYLGCPKPHDRNAKTPAPCTTSSHMCTQHLHYSVLEICVTSCARKQYQPTIITSPSSLTHNRYTPLLARIAYRISVATNQMHTTPDTTIERDRTHAAGGIRYNNIIRDWPLIAPSPNK